MEAVEPWGSEHILKRGDAFSVRSGALAKGNVEVSFVPNGISICFSSDDEVVETCRDRHPEVRPYPQGRDDWNQVSNSRGIVDSGGRLITFWYQ